MSHNLELSELVKLTISAKAEGLEEQAEMLFEISISVYGPETVQTAIDELVGIAGFALPTHCDPATDRHAAYRGACGSILIPRGKKKRYRG